MYVYVHVGVYEYTYIYLMFWTYNMINVTIIKF